MVQRAVKDSDPYITWAEETLSPGIWIAIN